MISLVEPLKAQPESLTSNYNYFSRIFQISFQNKGMKSSFHDYGQKTGLTSKDEGIF